MLEIIPAALITFMYFISGLSKITTFTAVATGFAGKLSVNLLLAQIVIVLVILLEVLAPLVIVFSENKKYKRYAAWALAGFTVLATILYHLPPTGNNYYQFLSNITATGALVLLGGGALPLNPLARGI